jgi:hypothetical protein
MTRSVHGIRAGIGAMQRESYVTAGWLALSLIICIAIRAEAADVQRVLLRPAFPGQHAPPAESQPGEPTSAPSPATQPANAPPGTAVQPPLGPPRIIEQPQPDEKFPPSGFAGPISAGSRSQEDSNFLPIPDRWRIGMPGNYADDTRGSLFDPYHQNVLKGDYPIIGQDKFLVLTLTSDTLFEARKTPTPSGISSARPDSFEFFGHGESQIASENFILSADFFQGDAAYRPRDWEFRFTGVANGNFVHTSELGLVNPDVGQGRDRTDSDLAIQEFFAEYKIADLSSNFDFVSVRGGIQGFTSDFRGFLFSDDEPGLRLFGTFDENRYQYNAVWFSQLEKDTNSGLNTLELRNQNVFIANLYRQDFLVPGYTTQFSFQANIDHGGGIHYDTNGFLVRPAPVGTIRQKNVNAYYFGWAGDGHIGRLNITHQFYQVLGNESFNPIAGRSVDINAQFAAVELSYDVDYVRFRTSFLYSSGDHHPQSGEATGFDSIFDNPNFAGGGFSYFDRQSIRLTGSGVNLVNRFSLIPDLRTSKEQGQANFVNPGLFLYNVGADIDVTPEVKVITNISYLRFDSTKPIEMILEDHHIRPDIGIDYSIGVRYRPLLNNNLILTAGIAALVPGNGFKDIYNSATLYSGFVAATVTY